MLLNWHFLWHCSVIYTPQVGIRGLALVISAGNEHSFLFWCSNFRFIDDNYTIMMANIWDGWKLLRPGSLDSWIGRFMMSLFCQVDQPKKSVNCNFWSQPVLMHVGLLCTAFCLSVQVCESYAVRSTCRILATSSKVTWVRVKVHISKGQIRIPTKACNNVKLLHFLSLKVEVSRLE